MKRALGGKAYGLRVDAAAVVVVGGDAVETCVVDMDAVECDSSNAVAFAVVAVADSVEGKGMDKVAAVVIELAIVVVVVPLVDAFR